MHGRGQMEHDQGEGNPEREGERRGPSLHARFSSSPRFNGAAAAAISERLSSNSVTDCEVYSHATALAGKEGKGNRMKKIGNRNERPANVPIFYFLVSIF